MEWTPDRIETVKTMWLDGYSASRIAMQLGGVSRNGVIGKVYRLGLPKRARSAKYSTNANAQKIIWTEAMDATLRDNWAEHGCGEGMVELLNISSASIHYRAKRLGLPFRERSKTSRGTKRTVFIPPNVAEPASYRNVTLPELEPSHCRYPMWGEGPTEYRYCGNDKAIGSSYCPYHHVACWRSAQR